MAYTAPVLLAAALALLAYILTFIYQSYRSSPDFEAFARANNCQPPVLSRGYLPWGLDRIYKILTYKGTDFLEDFIFARFRSKGRWTVITPTFGRTFTVLTAEPRNIQAILSTQFADFGVGKRRYQQFGPLLGYGIFTTDGPAWEHSRAILRPQFSSKQVNDLQAAEKHLQRLFQALPVISDDGWTERIDLAPLFLRFMLDLATEWLFGKSVDSQLAALANFESSKASIDAHEAEGPLSHLGHLERSFDTAFSTAQETIAWRVRMQGLYWLIDSRKFRSACSLLHTWADHFVGEALEAKKANNNHNDQENTASTPTGPLNGTAPAPADAKPKYSVLASMLTQTSDPLLLRAQSLSLLLASRDTTSRLLSFVFLELSRHPEIYAVFRTHVLATFGPDPSRPSSTPIQPLTPQTLTAFAPLQHLLSETLRLYPLVPLNNRTALRPTSLPLGGGPAGLAPLALPAGTLVTFASYVTHRRPDIWGPDADQWRPSRWVGRKGGLGSGMGGECVPFLMGPRVCVGMGWAVAVAGLVVVRMAQRWEAVGGGEAEVRKGMGMGLILAPVGGVRVRLRRGGGGRSD